MSDFRVFSGVGTLGTFVTMCILAVEITGPRYYNSIKIKMEYF